MKTYRCPGCGSSSEVVRMQYLYLNNPPRVAIMCWDVCGMDFEVNLFYWMMNSWGEEE